jgi:hypothetical protein
MATLITNQMENTTVFGASDDLIEFRGGIYEEFNDFDPKSGLLEFSDGSRFKVSYPWSFKPENLGPAFLSVGYDDDEESDVLTMGAIDWVKYTDDEGNTQRAYRKGLANPVKEIRRLIERHGEEAAELIQQLFEKRAVPTPDAAAAGETAGRS